MNKKLKIFKPKVMLRNSTENNKTYLMFPPFDYLGIGSYFLECEDKQQAECIKEFI